MILAAISACTVAVAYFSHASDGLWSLLLLFAWQSYETDDGEEEQEEEQEQDKPDPGELAAKKVEVWP